MSVLFVDLKELGVRHFSRFSRSGLSALPTTLDFALRKYGDREIWGKYGDRKYGEIWGQEIWGQTGRTPIVSSRSENHHGLI